jgi:flagellar hook protein FlgE
LQPAITFDADGLPKSFGVGKMAVDGFVSGAASMDGTSASQITLDFGSLGEADGITQLSAEFTPNFIERNGARFGVFSGATISSDGLVTALFDNGERRPIYRVPLVTFVNPDGLEAQTGNVWNTTEAAGNPTLRVADSGPAGQIVQSSLEASTVDIGKEFIDMIVVQRAYSAATKIISTADEMLDELVHIKR